MLVPISWLKEYCKTELSAPDLAAKLTASGSSVERTYHIGTGLDDLIVGKIIKVKPHPNADRLQIAEVDTGSQQVEVVCGAHNIADGQHIVYAPQGATIPVNMHDDKRRPFTLKKATIRGVESQGMICSVAEMGIGDDHEGILVLPSDTKVGQKITQALDWPQTVFDIEVTTNRSDELSLIGLAREVSVLTGTPLQIPTSPELKALASHAFDPIIQSENCYRLITQQLYVTVKESPWWIKQRLMLAGMRPINNIVDITNYVMLEFGQPFHAYDTTQLAGQKLLVRPAQPNEKITTLDGVERTLTSDITVIADEEKALSIAGIMGGQASKIADNTTQILIEAAVFDPIAVRKSANQLALRSEASKRFERGVDREMTDRATTRLVELLVKYADAKSIGPRRNSYPQQLEPKQITITSRKLAQYLGQPIDPLQVRTILKSLGFGDTSAFGKNDNWEIAAWVPSSRTLDITEEVDLIEDVVRILGYENLPIQLPTGALPNAGASHEYETKWHMKNSFAQAGWTEAVTLSLTGPELSEQLGAEKPAIAISNPLSTDWSHMRSSLLPGLLQTVRSNARWELQQQLYELSHVYRPANTGLPSQDLHLALISTGHESLEVNLGRVKGALEQVAARQGLTHKFSYQKSDKAPAIFDKKNVVAVHINDQPVGHIGTLPRSIRQQFDLPELLIMAELSADLFLQQSQPIKIAPIPEYPSLEEDISVIVAESAQAGQIKELLQQTGGPLLESISLTEIYRHEKLGDNVKSLTFHLTYRASDHTLSSKEIASIRKKLTAALTKEGWNVRD